MARRIETRVALPLGADGSGGARPLRFNRRGLLRAGAAGLAAVVMAPRAGAAPTGMTLPRALARSDLVYVTPLHANGRESRCQAEVWFVLDGGDAVVVTAADAWRARAVGQGLRTARLWVGDEGVWTDSDSAYRELPSAVAEVSLIEDPDEHARLLEQFGDKYSLSWVLWGPRFRNGLKDGSRVMLKYRPMPEASG